MNYDIRKICVYFKNIHSRYYIDTNKIVYSSISPFINKITINGKRYNINGFRQTNLSKMNTTNKMLIKLLSFDGYFMLYNGEILQRIQTKIDQNGNSNIALINVNGNITRYDSQMLVEKVFGLNAN